jgi:hypothetical protein
MARASRCEKSDSFSKSSGHSLAAPAQAEPPTDAIFAEQNIGFITGISLNRDGDTVRGVSFYIDRLNPENSVVSERKAATAREI